MSFISNKNSQSNNVQPEVLIKIVFVGESGVGKTNLINREATDTFEQQHMATIGVDFRIKSYDLGLLKVKAQMWDTAGQERFRSIQKPYYRGAKAVCLCFSLADRRSFLELDRWINELSDFQVSLEQVVLIGCKSDLDCQVATDQILVYAQEKNIPYYQTSALTAQGVNEAFRSIMVACAQREIRDAPNREKLQNVEKSNLMQKMGQAKNKGCC